jgi:trk system potassium uptake protein TrkH
MEAPIKRPSDPLLPFDRAARLRRLTRVRHPARDLVTLFFFMTMVGTVLLRLPLCAREESADWSTALFTATSATCVTGLAVVDTAGFWSPLGQGVILLLIQAGGLGYMTASTFLAMVLRRQPDLNARLLLRETLGEVTLADTLQLFAGAVRFTLIVEGIGAALLTVRFLTEPGRSPGDALWRGVFHAVSAFCNAGFDLFGQDGHAVGSLGGYRSDWLVNVTVMALLIIGGLGYPVCVELARRRGNRPFSLHTRIVLVANAALLLFGWITILITEWSNPGTLQPMPLADKLLAGLFQSATTRTAGFATVDFGNLRSITLLVMGLLMVIGASPGGTGGGIKTTSFAVALLAMRASLRGSPDMEVFDRRIPTEQVLRTMLLIFLSMGILIGASFILVMTEPEALAAGGIRENLFVRIQFDTMSALGTTGLSTGVTPLLTDSGRIVIIVLMFIGRIGPVTAASAWAAPGPLPKRRLPEERVSLG